MVIGKWCPPDHEALVDALIVYMKRETVKNNKDTLRSIALLEHLPPSSPIIDMLTYLLANHHKNIPLYIQKLSEIASITDDPSIWEDITGFYELFAIRNREQLTHDLGENSLQNNRYMQYFSKMYALLPQVLREQPYSEFPAKVEQLLTQISQAIKKDPSCIVKGTHHVM